MQKLVAGSIFTEAPDPANQQEYINRFLAMIQLEELQMLMDVSR
jgi:hypothetical protein